MRVGWSLRLEDSKYKKKTSESFKPPHVGRISWGRFSEAEKKFVNCAELARKKFSFYRDQPKVDLSKFRVKRCKRLERIIFLCEIKIKELFSPAP